jgi:hypothetical protein
MTPTVLVDELDALVPGFADYLRGADSLFAASDGTFSVHGVFSEFSVYLRDRYSTLPLHSARRLGVFLTRCFDDTYGDTVGNAVATCCLENLAGDPLHAALAKNLGDAAKHFYNGVVGL